MRLRYTPRAAAELEEILRYIQERSPKGARGVQRRIQAVIDLIQRQPRAGRSTGRERLRRLPVVPFPYLIYYEVTLDEVIIHGVRHGAQKPAAGLNDLPPT